MSIIIDPTVPPNSESPRQGASRIRTLTLELLSLFSQGGGSPVTINTAPFTLAATGEVSAVGLQNVCPTRVVKVLSAITVTTSATTIGSQAITMPSLGGPFRVLVQYCAFAAAGAAGSLETWVSDGTNTMAGALIDLAGAIPGAFVSSEFSPATYVNGAVVTFTLKGQTNAGSAPVGGNSLIQNRQSRLILTVLSSV